MPKFSKGYRSNPLFDSGPEEFSSPSQSNFETSCGFEIEKKLDFPLIEGHTYYVKGHCDGLLCVIINDGTIALWNPSIKEYKKLPIPCNFRNTREVLGLGYDSTINDYKLVRAPSSYCKCKIKDYHPQVEVLTLSTNSWRKLPDEDTPPYFIEHFLQAHTVNGGIYWLTLDDWATVILRFDLAKEKFKLVPEPPNELNRNISWLGVLKGSLCALHSHRFSYLDIWATKDDKNWSKLITIPKIRGPDPCLSSLDYGPLCFTQSGALLISVRGKGILAYDPKADSYRKLAVPEEQHWLSEIVYTESLVSPHGSNGSMDSRQQQQTGLSNSPVPRSLWQSVLGLTSGIVDHFSCYSGSNRRH
ncbi:F-box protein [Quillaja saponaria]|uniref:F-box protein n=1 Tax=Quillaja saponaria TaxID=32244 RepID=A0AAD7PRT2_QUISA|nr:F-box protein [Quillaja saponaria]